MHQHKLSNYLNPNPWLFWAYILPIIWWLYLIITTNMVIVFDSIGFEQLGRLLYNNQWQEYFKTGPNREPLYPLLIALSMHLGDWLNLSYEIIVKFFSLIWLLLTMIGLQKNLTIIRIPTVIQALAIAYTGLSPILINSALCLYSESLALPFFLAIIYFTYKILPELRGQEPFRLKQTVILSICLVLFTFIKGIGEALIPLFLSVIFFYAFKTQQQPCRIWFIKIRPILIILLCTIYIPLISYKSLNYVYNGHFSLTNRAIMSVYGKAIVRSQLPINLKNIESHLATVPTSYELCGLFFDNDTCHRLSMSFSDNTYINYQNSLAKQQLPTQQQERLTQQGIINAYIQKPFNQIIYTLIESLKMFFFETIRGAFVTYPIWLENLLNQQWVILFTCFGLAGFLIIGFLLTLVKFFTKSFNDIQRDLLVLALTLWFIHSLLFGTITIIHRYTIVSAPLLIFIAAIGYSGLIRNKTKL